MYLMYLHIIKTGQKCSTEHISCEVKLKLKQQWMLYFDEVVFRVLIRASFTRDFYIE